MSGLGGDLGQVLQRLCESLVEHVLVDQTPGQARVVGGEVEVQLTVTVWSITYGCLPVMCTNWWPIGTQSATTCLVAWPLPHQTSSIGTRLASSARFSACSRSRLFVNSIVRT
jgi:hypothetical protein